MCDPVIQVSVELLFFYSGLVLCILIIFLHFADSPGLYITFWRNTMIFLWNISLKKMYDLHNLWDFHFDTD